MHPKIRRLSLGPQNTIFGLVEKMLRSALLASACGLSFAVPGRTDGNAHTLSAPVPQGETYSQWIENLMASPQSSPQRDVIQASGSFVLGLKGGFVDELGVARTSDGVPAALGPQGRSRRCANPAVTSSDAKKGSPRAKKVHREPKKFIDPSPFSTNDHFPTNDQLFLGN